MQLSRPLPPGSTIGMLGGGQLGRMFAMAAASLGYRVMVLTDRNDCPAAAVAGQTLVGDLRDPATLQQLADRCQAVSLEFENIPADALDYLQTRLPVRPSADVLRVAQDRAFEKQTLQASGLPVAPFRLVNSLDDARQALQQLGAPIVLKTTRDGYDGKGQWKIDSAHALENLALENPAPGDPATATGAPPSASPFNVPLVAEAWVPYTKEVSVIIARSQVGDRREVAVYPVMENHHRHHILDVTICPADLPAAVSERATQMAIRAAEAIDLIGLICIEFFVLEDGNLLINEIAPRPHNSGHLTIDACDTSQFEQQVRAVCGLPLGNTALLTPAAAMINLMGEMWQDGPPDWAAVLRIDGCHLHLYDKGAAKPGRKMGHLTISGTATEVAHRVKQALQILRPQ